MGALNRRGFLHAGAQWSAVAGAVAMTGGVLQAQDPKAPVRRPDRYDENVLFNERKPFTWPGGATLAVWIVPNVEVFLFTPIAGSGSSDPDVLNYTWREYGMRVGLWRLADAMDALGVRGTVALNAAVC
jgi:hypothetical protein